MLVKVVLIVSVVVSGICASNSDDKLVIKKRSTIVVDGSIYSSNGWIEKN